MTGPGHYREAERLLKEADEHPDAEIAGTAWRAGRAQVHATLALAAATAIGAEGPDEGHGTQRPLPGSPSGSGLPSRIRPAPPAGRPHGRDRP